MAKGETMQKNNQARAVIVVAAFGSKNQPFRVPHGGESALDPLLGS
jgi:hypothetical protein